MLNSHKVMALIPARGGSKGLLSKNTRLLRGRPLICYSIDTGLASNLVDRVIVSTDSPEVAEIARTSRAEVPFIRPAELAQDLTPDLPVVGHCLDWCRDNNDFIPNLVVFLRPTGPLRTVEEIEEAIRMLESCPEADCVRSIEEPPKSPYKMWEPDGNFIRPFIKDFSGVKDFHTGPRQLLPKVYQTTPDVHVFRTTIVWSLGSIVGQKVLPFFLKRPTVDIDCELDLEIAEYLMKKQFSSS